MTKRTVVAVALAVVGLMSGLAVAGGQVQLDPGLQPYKAVSGVSGSISSVGSDTLNNLMTHWAETFSRFYPNAKVQIEGKGSSTAPPALIAGTAQLGPMSREMKGTEVDQFTVLGDQSVAVWTERQFPYHISLNEAVTHGLLRVGGIPEDHGVVRAAGGEITPVRAECQRPHRVEVTGQR